MPSTILITGASSGLGLGFVKHYASLPSPPTILAIDKTPFPEFSIPASSLKHIAFTQRDITSSSPSAFASDHLNTSISLILHCAGTRGLVPSIVDKYPNDVAAAETLTAMDTETLLRTFKVNTVGTFNVIKAFLPNLLLSASTSPSPQPQPQVIILSSRMGSVATNTTGGGYAYRASKAALNAVVKSFSVDVPEVQFLLLHPGRVETGLVRCKEEGAIGVDESVRDCLRVMVRMQEEEWGSGKLLDRFGDEIAW